MTISPYGDVSHALSLFHSVPKPNRFLFNTIIRSFSLSPSPNPAFHYYIEMLSSGLEPNSHTFPFLLKSCLSVETGRIVHGHVLKFGLDEDVFVHSSIVDMYARNGALADARKVFDESGIRDKVSFTALISGYMLKGCFEDACEVFDEMPVRDVVCWNAVIAGFCRMGRFEEGLRFFERMRGENVAPDVSTLVTVLSACARVGDVETGKWVRAWVEGHGLGSNRQVVNAMVDMYGKCGELDVARGLFDGIREKDRVSWNVMIGGYAHMGEYKDALEVFRLMQMDNVEPNDVTFLNVIPACANLGALDIGKWMHAYIEKHYHEFPNESLWTALINMYARCGNIEIAKQLFHGLESKSSSSWNAMILGLAMHGDATRAVELFSEMNEGRFRPDEITFVGVLSACCQSGLVDLGQEYFHSMIHDFGIPPQLQHYGCMIDLLGKAGLLDEAMELIERMDMEPDGAIWSSILGACRIHRNLELGEYAANKLFELEPDNSGAYVLLSNIYAGAGRWDDVAKIRTFLNDKGMKKVPGSTSIEVDGVVHEFLVSDRTHPKTDEIYRMLDEVDRLVEMAGHVLDTSEVYYDVDEEWKEGVLCEHSEKLAIAFGLISTKPGTTLRIVKNLRVCKNCHSVTKLVSKIFNREIIARDRNRFHHFKDGVCSCKDYW